MEKHGVENSSHSMTGEIDSRDLNVLLDTFQSFFSIEEITLAYQNAGCDIHLADKILSCKREDESYFTIGKSQKQCSMNDFQRPQYTNKQSRGSKTKGTSISMGGVSDVVGKGYTRSVPHVNQHYHTAKPIKMAWEKKMSLRKDLKDKASSDVIMKNDSNIHMIEQNRPISPKLKCKEKSTSTELWEKKSFIRDPEYEMNSDLVPKKEPVESLIKPHISTSSWKMEWTKESTTTELSGKKSFIKHPEHVMRSGLVMKKNPVRSLIKPHISTSSSKMKWNKKSTATELCGETSFIRDPGYEMKSDFMMKKEPVGSLIKPHISTSSLKMIWKEKSTGTDTTDNSLKMDYIMKNDSIKPPDTCHEKEQKEVEWRKLENFVTARDQILCGYKAIKSPKCGSEEAISNFLIKKEPMDNRDVEEFLFSMLGEGFHLSIDEIREVLGCCGYDVKESIEQFMCTSPSTLDTSRETFCTGKIVTDESPILESGSSSERFQDSDFAERNEVSTLEKEKHDLPRALLCSLFKVPERDEIPAKRCHVQAVKPTKFKFTSEPIISSSSNTVSNEINSQQLEDVNEVEEDTYQILRKAVKQNNEIMKDYYQAAMDAFTKGDRDKVNYFFEQVNFHMKKAREADEKASTESLKSIESQSEMTLDLHDHTAKEAIRLLKFHLKSCSRISYIQLLRIILERNGEDSTKGSRKRMVLKLLEREHIKSELVEESNTKIVLIRVDDINPEKLSFADSSQE